MIQNNSILQVVDNSGAKKVLCIKVFSGYRKRYGESGDLITVSVKTMRKKRKISSKIKKGSIAKALIIRTKKGTKNLNEKYSFKENACVLLTKQNKLLGTRIFGSIPSDFRYSKFLRLTSLASGTS